VIVQAAAPARHGYLLVREGAVVPARDFGELVELVARAYRKGQSAEARARVTLTRDRALTTEETARLVEAATNLLV
jgi:hypothetical protein